MTDIRDEVAAALRDEIVRLVWKARELDNPNAVVDDLFALAARGLTVVREDDCHCAERNVTHGRGCPCGNLARQPEGPR